MVVKKLNELLYNDENINMIIFEPQTDSDVVKGQELAFQNGYTWYGGTTRISYKNLTNCKYIFYETEVKKITIADDLEGMTHKQFLDEYYDGDMDFIIINDIYKLKRILNPNITFDDIYDKENKLIYEKLENRIRVVVSQLPQDINSKKSIYNYLISNGFEHRESLSTDLIVKNLENANIIHILVKNKAFLLINKEGGIEEFVISDLKYINEDEIEVLNNYTEIFGLFGKTSFNPTNYFKNNLVYESVENGKIDYVIFYIETPKQCLMVQNEAFKYGYTWNYYDPTRILHQFDAKILYFETKNKIITYSPDYRNEEDIISDYRDEYNSIVECAKNINILINFFKFGKLEEKEYDIFYNKKNNLVYESLTKKDVIAYKIESIDILKNVYKYLFENEYEFCGGGTHIGNSDLDIYYLFIEIGDKTLSFTTTNDNKNTIQSYFLKKNIIYVDSFNEIKKLLTPININTYFDSKLVYEKIDTYYQYIDVTLPDDLEERNKYITILTKLGYKERNFVTHDAIVDNIGDANILHIFTGNFDKEYFFIKKVGGIESFLSEDLRNVRSQVLVVQSWKHFLKVFDELTIDNYFDTQNVYE